MHFMRFRSRGNSIKEYVFVPSRGYIRATYQRFAEVRRKARGIFYNYTAASPGSLDFARDDVIIRIR